MANKLKELIKAGRPVFGFFVTIGHPEVAEILSLLSPDWLLVDLEHTSISLSETEAVFIAIKPPVIPMVRVPANDEAWIKRALDIGALGVMVPHVDSREDARRAVRYAKYPPLGSRGVGPRRAAVYGLRKREYLEEANEETLLIVQIESKEAVENAEDILSMEGVDAYFIGPADLAASVGVIGNTKDENVQALIERVVEIGESLGVPGGTYCGDRESLERSLKIGLKILALGSDYKLLLRCGGELLREARGLASH